MDKSWIDIDRTDDRYEKGIIFFLEFAFRNQPEGKKLRCPCNHCDNRVFLNKKEMYDHLIVHGFDTTYKRWYHHGESFFTSNKEGGNGIHKLDAMQEMLHDFGCGYKINEGLEECVGSSSCNPNKEAADFYRLLREAEQELYPGCQSFSRLSFIVELVNIKCLYGLSCKAMDAILDLITKVLPKDNKVPRSYYEAKKLFENLGLKYEKIDACLNDCILYRGNYKDLDFCPICGACRWRSSGKQVIGKQVACKILRYFPLKDRVKKLYMSPKIASEMKWHKEKCPSDDYMRHPADSYAWKSFDSQHPSFAADPRNIRLGLASDGFNPFGSMSTSYSVWPIILVNYNLPPWMCMKDPYFMLSMLIPGPKAPGNDIDVYLQPLIDELKDLWENGVETYDAASKSNFTLRVALLWTIGDYPGLAVLSGQSTKGKYACLICNDDTCSLWLPNGHKHCYMGHRRFLPSNHPWRNDAKAFDGKLEHRAAPKELTGADVVEKYKLFNQVTFGKSKKRKRGDEALPGGWRKKSIFFELSYWKTLMIRHNLDVMHIARNVFVSVFGTLMDIKGRTKDTIDTRFDLELMGIRSELHAKWETDNTFSYKTACHTLSSKEKKALYSFISAIKVPDGYSSNVSRYVNGNECNLAAMKCHDCHIFLQRFLPLAIRGVLKKEVCEPLIELSAFFRKLCAKKLLVEDMEMLDGSIVLTLCKLEKVFPPSFFDIMIHLTIHLARQAIVAGPVTFRWMYFVERFLRRLKSYVRNKANPEGSIAELYIAQEAVTFCSLYLEDVETKLNRVGRNYEGNDESVTYKLNIFKHAGRSLRGKKYERLSLIEWQQARSYVLRNCEDISHLMELHKEEFEVNSKNIVGHQHDAEFEQWFKRYVFHLKYEGSEVYDEELEILACGPDQRVTKYTSYLVNGWKFCTKDYDMKLKTQNSGVFVKGDEGTGHTDYFGELIDIIELDYQGHIVVLFKCDWWDVSSRGCKEDKYGFTLVNVTRKLKNSSNEPFILATQAEQVYYVPDTKDPNWQVVIKTKPRDLYDFPLDEDAFGPCQEDEDIGAIQQENLFDSEEGMLSRDELVEVHVDQGPINCEMVIENDDGEDEVDYDDDLLSSDDEIQVLDEDTDDDL